MDIRLELAEEADKAPDSDEVSPEERLQRLVLNSLRAEQEQPVDAPAVASPEPVRAETGGWRGLNLFLALVIAGAAAGGSLLLIIGQHDFGQDAPPRSNHCDGTNPCSVTAGPTAGGTAGPIAGPTAAHGHGRPTAGSSGTAAPTCSTRCRTRGRLGSAG